MKYEPIKMIFVVGTGRSGTSTIARVLHNNNICCMGHKFRSPDERNQQGYWEDLVMRKRELHWLADEFIPASKVCDSMESYHYKHICKAFTPNTRMPVLGYKHPLLAEVSHDRWAALNPYHIFWAIRPRTMVVNSLRRWAEKGTTSAVLRRLGPEEFYDDKMRKLEAAMLGLPRVTKIDFSELRTDSWVLKQIGEALQ